MSARLVGWIRGSGRLDRPIAAVARLGATSENEVSIPVDGVSRHHAQITEEADGFWIEDAKSRNGTWVNGERATTRLKLNHLDVITLGRFAELVFLMRAGEAAAPVALRVRIEWLNGPSAGTFVEINQGETILGRADSCGIVVDNGAISRAHLRFTHTGERVAIEDLGSANGTAVNGRPLAGSFTLEPGAEVELGGERRFRVHIEGDTAPVAQGAAGAAPGPAQDMEWMTRLVWSESDLEAVRAGLVQSGKLPSGKRDKTKPRSIPATGASPATPPVAPPPAAAAAPAQAPKTALAPPPAPAVSPIPGQPASVSAATKLGVPALGAPPVPAAADQTPAGTVIDEPDFAGPPPAGPVAGHATSLDLGAPAPALPADLSRPRPSGEPRRVPVQRPDLPRETVLGYRDVAPGVPRAGMSTAGQPRTDVPASTPGEAQEPIRGVRLTGSVGTFELPLGTVASIGRSEQATVRIDSRDVSRIHAVLTVGEQGVALEDKGSVNGTLLNGAPLLGTRPLGDGDQFAIADFEFYVEFLRTETKP